MVTDSPPEEVLQDSQIVEQILDRVLSSWDRTQGSYETPWKTQREAAYRAIAQMEQQEELDANLRENSPILSARSLHPWIWESCRTLWSTRHYRDAVGAAARALNAKAQQKLDRRDLAEWKLLMNAFQVKPPVAGEPRLRLTSSRTRAAHRCTLRLWDWPGGGCSTVPACVICACTTLAIPAARSCTCGGFRSL